MRDYQLKQNIGGTPDSITDTKFGAGEFNSIAVELEGAVTTSGQTLAPADGTGEDTSQLSKALSVYGSGGDFYVDTGAANAYVLDRAGSLAEVEDYFDGMKCVFVSANANTGASTVNVATLGVKSITRIGGTALSAGDISAGEHVVLRFDSANDRFEIEIYSGVKALKFDGLNASVVDEGLVITDQGSTAAENPLSALTPSMPNSGYNSIYFGKALSQYNAGALSYRHVSDGSAANNFARVGLYAGDGYFNVYGDGHAALTAGYLDITDDRDVDGMRSLTTLFPNLSTGRTGYVGYGVAATNYNSVLQSFTYNGAGLQTNEYRVGLWNNATAFRLNGYGNVGIGSAPAGSGGARLSVLDAGSTTAEFPATFLTSNMPNGGASNIVVGKALTQYNSGTLGHTHTSDGNDQNNVYMRSFLGDGYFRLYGDGHAALTAGYLNITDDRDIDGMTTLSALNPNLTATARSIYRFGVAASNYNSGEMAFYYTGSGSQGNEIWIGLYNDPTGFRLNGYGNVGIGGAPAGSGGDRLTVSGDASISGALTVGGSPITSAGQMATSATGEPLIDTTFIDVDSVVTIDTWESVGPTGSGATNIWTSLDGIPNGADWIKVRLDIGGDDGSASTNLTIRVYAREYGSTAGVTYTSIAKVSGRSDSGGACFVGNVVEAVIPVDASNRFDIRWTGSFTTNTVNMWAVGYGYNE